MHLKSKDWIKRGKHNVCIYLCLHVFMGLGLIFIAKVNEADSKTKI